MFFCMSLIKMASFFFWLSFFPLPSSSLKLLFFYFLQNKKIAQPNKPYKIALFDNTGLSSAWFFKWHLVAAQATIQLGCNLWITLPSEGIKYSNQEYTRVGYPILGYFRVQVPENLWKTSSSSFKLARKFSSKLGT